jgi:hypothetical protein
MRLFFGKWSSGVESPLDEEALAQCVCDYVYPIRMDRLREQGWVFVGGADLSATRDHSAVTLLAVNSALGKFRMAWSRRFQPRNGKVDLLDVAQTMRNLYQQFWPDCWYMDGFETRRLSMEFKRFGARVQIQSMQGTTSAVAAAALLSSVNSSQLEIHRSGTGLLEDLRSLKITERAGILKVTATPDQRGHADQAFSLLACIAGAQELCSRRYVGTPGEITTGWASGRRSCDGVQVIRPRGCRLCRDSVPFDTSHGTGNRQL